MSTIHNNSSSRDSNISVPRATAVTPGYQSLNKEIQVALKTESRSIYARVKAYFNTVKVSIQNENDESPKTLELNISSIAHKLGISRSLVRTIARRPDALEHFTRIADEVTKINKIQRKCTKHLRGMNPDIRLPRKAGKKFIARHELRSLETKRSGTLGTFKYVNHRFFIEHVGKGEIVLYVSEKKGSGSFAHYYKITQLGTDTTTGLKKARKKYNGERSRIPGKDLLHEKTILDRINPHGDIEGLLPPSGVISGGMTKVMPFSEDLYMAAGKLASMPMGEVLELFRQLQNGLAEMHSQRCIHGDIKPENCLIKYAEGNIPAKCVLTDFGGAKIMTDTMSINIYTPIYIAPDDSSKHDSIERYQKLDVYALSKTMIETILNGRLRTRKDQQFFEKFVEEGAVYTKEFHNTMLELLVNVGVPPNVANVLIWGIAPYNKRPLAAQMYEAFAQAIQTA